MELPTFTIIHAPPDTLILHSREHPYHFARILKYPGNMQLAEARRNLIQERVPGYNIIVALAGSLEGRIFISAEGTHRLEVLVRDMMNWYAEEVVNKQELKFKKYRL